MKLAPGKRTKIEIQLAAFVELSLITMDEETLDYIKHRNADLEEKLRNGVE